MLWLKLRQLTKSKDPAIRLRAVQQIKKTQTRSANAVEALIAALKDEDESVACISAEVLAEIGNSAAVEGLIDGLSRSDRFQHYDKLRKGCALALGKLGDERAIQPLAQLATRPSDRTRGTTSYAWWNLHLDLRLEEIQIIQSAVWALTRIAGGCRAIDALSAFLSVEHPRDRRENAAYALRQIPEYNKSVASELGDKIRPIFKAWVEGSSHKPGTIDCRQLPNGWLGTTEGSDALAIILLVAVEHWEYDHWLELLGALDRAGNTFNLRRIIDVIRARHRENPCDEAVVELGQAFIAAIGNDAVPTLSMALHSKDRWMQTFAAAALEGSGSEGAVTELSSCLTVLNGRALLIAARAARTIDPLRVVMPLINLTQDEDTAEEAAVILTRLLESRVDSVETVDLQGLASLKDKRWHVGYGGPDDDPAYDVPVYKQVDLSKPRQLARDELIRRGFDVKTGVGN